VCCCKDVKGLLWLLVTSCINLILRFVMLIIVIVLHAQFVSTSRHSPLSSTTFFSCTLSLAYLLDACYPFRSPLDYFFPKCKRPSLFSSSLFFSRQAKELEDYDNCKSSLDASTGEELSDDSWEVVLGCRSLLSTLDRGYQVGLVGNTRRKLRA
jgi:hypothetical protein